MNANKVLVLLIVCLMRNTSTGQYVAGDNKVEIVIDGKPMTSVLEAWELFESTTSRESQGMAAAILVSQLSAQQAQSFRQAPSEQLLVLLRWERLRKTLDLRTQESRASRLAFLESVATELNAQFPNDLQLLAVRPYSIFHEFWDAALTSGNPPRLGKIVNIDGKVSLNGGQTLDEGLGASLLSLVESEALLAHAWCGHSLIIAVESGVNDGSEYARLICLSNDGNALWQRKLQVWTIAALEPMHITFLRLVPCDAGSFVVFSVFPGSCGIERISTQDGASSFTFFSAIPRLLPLTPGQG